METHNNLNATLKQPVKQEEKPVKITFGIQPKHLEVINTLLAKYDSIEIGGELHPGIMLYSEAFWQEVGKQIGWLPFTIALHYFKYINKTQTLPHDNN